MKITILNGEPEAGSPFDVYVHEIAAKLGSSGNDASVLELRDLNLKGCSGCWGCWVRTPGECTKRDDSELVCREVIGSDLAVMASPITMGFTTALLKRAVDQMIPLVHPYLTIEGGEMHHLPRYERYPLMGLLLGPDAETDADDVAITQQMWSRTARNLKSRLAFTAVMDRPAEEVADEFFAVA